MHFKVESANGKVRARIDYLDYNFAVFKFDSDGDGELESGQRFASIEEFVTGDVTLIDLQPIEQINRPPYVDVPYVYTWMPSTLTEINVDIGYYDDLDTPFDQLQAELIWKLNGVEIKPTTPTTLAPGIAVFGDVLTVAMRVSDGYNVVVGQPVQITVIDTPPTLQLGDVPAAIAAGEQLTITARFVDPDSADNVPQAATLAYGPPGMTISADGVLTWQVPSQLLPEAEVFFAVQAPGIEQPQRASLRVRDPLAPFPVARAGIEVPKTNYNMLIADVFGSGKNRVISTDNNYRLFTLAGDGNGFALDWLYPFELPTGGAISQIATFDMNQDGTLELVVATDHGVSLVEQSDQPARALWRTAAFIAAMAITDADDDGAPEVALLVSDREGPFYNTRQLIVLELGAEVTQVFASPVPENSRELRFGNVDADAAAELIINSGLVYDAVTWTNQWFSGAPFGETMLALVDLDGDSIEEVVGANDWGAVSVYSVLSKSMLYTAGEFNTCSLNGANIDTDAAGELLVGDCQWGNIKAYSWSAGRLVQDWQLDMHGHGSKSIAVGDSDNDGALEIHWGSNQSSSGADQFVMAELGAIPAVRWTTEQSVQLDTFTAAGWGEVTPGEERAVFIVPRTNSGYDGQRLLFMADNGDYTISAETNTNWEGGRTGKVVDYDQDGYADIFLSGAFLYDGNFSVIQLHDMATLWAIAGDHDSNVNAVDALDFNGDQALDAIYVDGRAVYAVDILNQTLLASASLEIDVAAIAATHLPTLGLQLLATASSYDGPLILWHRVGSQLVEFDRAAATSCSKLQWGDVDADGALELVCLGSTYSYSGSLQFSIFEVGADGLAEPKTIMVEEQIVDFAILPGAAPQILALENDDNNFYMEKTYLTAYDGLTGRKIWRGQALIGGSSAQSLVVRGDVAAGTAQIATSQAMYLLQW